MGVMDRALPPRLRLGGDADAVALSYPEKRITVNIRPYTVRRDVPRRSGDTLRGRVSSSLDLGRGWPGRGGLGGWVVVLGKLQRIPGRHLPVTPVDHGLQWHLILAQLEQLSQICLSQHGDSASPGCLHLMLRELRQ